MICTADDIEAAFARAGVNRLPPRAFAQFLTYLELLLRWNARLDLTSVLEPEDIIRRHFAECAFAALHLPPGIESVLDFGSGAGLPGIPIAICCPEIRVTLAESQGKKTSFLREVVRALGIQVEVHGGRVEAMPVERRFHGVSLRAVEKMKIALPEAARRAEKYLVMLTTERSGAAYFDLTPEFKWRDPIHLPNTEQIVLAIGQRREPV
jgi:16S rRNA (guanine527-N7)-methyltransferase